MHPSIDPSTFSSPCSKKGIGKKKNIDVFTLHRRTACKRASRRQQRGSRRGVCQGADDVYREDVEVAEALHRLNEVIYPPASGLCSRIVVRKGLLHTSTIRLYCRGVCKAYCRIKERLLYVVERSVNLDSDLSP
jgi:hypothetical protein